MERKLLLIGAGDHCCSVLDSLLSQAHSFKDIGIIDKKGEFIRGISVVGCDEDLQHLFEEGYTDAFISIGSIGNTTLRQKLFQKVRAIGFNIPNIIDESAVVSINVVLQQGIFIGKKAVVNTEVKIEDGAIVNTGAILEHHCHIGAFTHVAPGSVLCGNVHVGSHTHIGAATTVKQNVRIGQKSMIGMGSVVLNNITDNVMAFGNPCKEVQRL